LSDTNPTETGEQINDSFKNETATVKKAVYEQKNVQQTAEGARNKVDCHLKDYKPKPVTSDFALESAADCHEGAVDPSQQLLQLDYCWRTFEYFVVDGCYDASQIPS
jgi:hypothetical protein